jgi:hypothetical protein
MSKQTKLKLLFFDFAGLIKKEVVQSKLINKKSQLAEWVIL